MLKQAQLLPGIISLAFSLSLLLLFYHPRIQADDQTHPTVADTVTPSSSDLSNESSSSVDSSHWALEPLKCATPPEVVDSDWPSVPLDRFVLAELEAHRLEPVADADKKDFIRRVAFQLTGLPPSVTAVEAFMSDERADARERLVDTLIASPQFGERWGRHWLDLARYADSNGLDENFLFREAWRYRNWVRDAVSADMPFDRFLLEQIAGDLLPYGSLEQRDRQRIAAGFLVIGPKVLLGNNAENQKMDVADELLDTIGKAVLGQTLGCARCHDHKFDPVPTVDYYALAGIFASTKVMEKRFMLGEQRVMERLVGLGETGDELDEAYEKYYRELPALRERSSQAKAALALLRQARDEVLTADEREKYAGALAAAAADTTLPVTERIEAQEALVADIAESLAHPPTIPPRAMIPADVEKPSDEHVRMAGQFDQLGEKVPRGFLTVLCDRSQVEIPTDQSGRVALCNWLCDGEQRSGQLAARVLANRIWHHLIGRGLVRTVDNFGITGEAPSHPLLLDYLAQRLIDSNWSIKSLVREIVLSRTFALSSAINTANASVDPENRWLWRANRRRLDPESFRDAMLMTAGSLELKVMESTVWYLHDQATAVGGNPVRRRTDFPCRSFYLPVIRNDLPEIFEAFDFANPHAATGARPNTTAPGQALFVLNDEMVMTASESTAQRLLQEIPADDSIARARLLYTWITNSLPTEAAEQSTRAFVEDLTAQFKSQSVENAELRAWAMACHAAFASSRFQYLD